MHEVFASLFNDRAISYRVHQGFDHSRSRLSAGIQYMVRSDVGSSGVMFTLDTDSGFRDVVFITASYGLGETVVQGAVNPDEFYVYKPALRAGHHPILRRTLGAKAIKMVYARAGRSARARAHGRRARSGPHALLPDRRRHRRTRRARRSIIEEHYGCPMDIEWGKDGETGKIVRSSGPAGDRAEPRGPHDSPLHAERSARVLVTGRSIGQRIGAGPARVVRDIREMARVETATCSSPT